MNDLPLCAMACPCSARGAAALRGEELVVLWIVSHQRLYSKGKDNIVKRSLFLYYFFLYEAGLIWILF